MPISRTSEASLATEECVQPRTFVGSVLTALPTFFLSLMNNLFKIFGKSNGIIVGVIHFPPLQGHADAPPLHSALENALSDLHAFEVGGADAVIIENNYDLPHTITVEPEVIVAMTTLGTEIRAATKLPIGVCVLWNDYEAAFTIAKAIGAQFIRVPVFVDEIDTDFGRILGNPAAVQAAREKLHAEKIALLVDVHVKHARLISKTTVSQAATAAVDQGADGIIITGKWTGDPPSLDDLSLVRNALPEAAIFAGSGVTAENIQGINRFANGEIVSTSLKSGNAHSEERNVKSWRQRIDPERVKFLVQATKLFSPLSPL